MKEEQNQEVAVIEPQSQGVSVAQTQSRTIASRFTAEELAQSDINSGAMIPDTTQTAALPVKLNEQNWSPEIGEVKDFVIVEIGMKSFPSMNPDKQGQSELVKTVSMGALAHDKDGNPKIERWSISAKLAVSTIEDAVNRGFLILGNCKTMARITYTGEVRNKTNSFKSKNFDIEIVVTN
jgi:hypothetical protein